MDLSTPLSQVNGIGPAFVRRLEKLNLKTVEDLIHHYPFRYEDFSKVSQIVDARLEEKVTLRGEVWQIKNAYTRFRKVITKAVLNDGSGSIELTWFNQPYLTKAIKVGDRLNVAGKVDKFGGKLTIIAPDWEKDDRSVHTGRLVPVYPETAGLSSKYLRNQISKVLPHIQPQLEDFLPEEVKDNLLSLEEAVATIHFPKDLEEAKLARDRLEFDELFLISLAVQQTRARWQQKQLVKPWGFSENDLSHFISSLPFTLTAAQTRVIGEIASDLKKKHPINRLVQGEVGSGKTVVSAAAIYLAKINGFESLLLAPTEILAWQHYSTLTKFLSPLGVSVGLYTRSRKIVAQNDVVVGTHALLSDKIKPEKVGLVVVDEQHRFGVQQRTLLRQKGAAPHLLTMTATPIPRTVALTVYGDLDLSVIDELPGGRQVVKTYVVPEAKRHDAYGFIAKKIKAGDQVYIVTPLIEESETQKTVKAAKIEYERLQKVFPNLKLGLLHGRMKAKEKEEVIGKFRAGNIQILVSTSVVEVGVDIPNATIMLIEGAQKFGLAQLHQLRGRVGRGEKQSYCLLFAGEESAQDSRRLKYLENTHDGLKLAELDLKIRGAGAIFGYSQHGRFDLKLAKLSDLNLIEKTKAAASKVLAPDPSLDKYPLLKRKLSSIAQEVAPD